MPKDLKYEKLKKRLENIGNVNCQAIFGFVMVIVLDVFISFFSWQNLIFKPFNCLAYKS